MARTRATHTRKRRNQELPTSVVDRDAESSYQRVGPAQMAMLQRADSKTRAHVIRQLQRHVGNRFVQRVIQRIPDAQQWDEDWTNFSGQQHYFAGSGRPAGTPRQRYDVLCPLYKAHGVSRPMQYMATSITNAKFYQFSTPAHSGVATALAAAEKTLKGKGYATAPVKKVWALNPRTTSTGAWSNHADGKAVDIDPDENPHITSKNERKIISVVTGTDLNKGGQGYDVMKGASDKFAADYNPAGLAKRITELKAAEQTKQTEHDTAVAERDTLKGQQGTLKIQRDALKKQLLAIPKGKKATATSAADAAALKASMQQLDTQSKQVQAEIKLKEAELKKKKAALSDATKDRELIEKQLAAYQATDKAIADLTSAVAALPAEIKALEDQIAQSKKDEQAAKDAKDSKGAKAQQTLRATLNQALAKKNASLKKQQKQLSTKQKQRDADPLRGYAAGGFVNLSKDFVEAMTGAGLKWGGNWEGAKDFMHFDL